MFKINILKILGVFQWLKTLRLHKYIDHFSQFTYDEFLNVTDSKLIELNITLGARKRLLNNIETLNDRCKKLKQLNTLIDESFFEKSETILKELLEISTTPMKYQNSKYTSLSSINYEMLNTKFYFDEEINEDLSSNFIHLIEKGNVKRTYIREKNISFL